MTPIDILIDHKLRVRVEDLPAGALEAMQDALSIPNLAKEKARKMDEWGWQRMPDYIELFEFGYDPLAPDEKILVMPRGFLSDLANGLYAFGADCKLVEGRHWHKLLHLQRPTDWELHPWQQQQLQALLNHEQGILKAPAGSGKTVAILAALSRLNCKSIVLVNTKDILWQWQKRAATFLGENYPVGQIGDGKFDVSPYLTVATAQTLHSRFDELEDQGFFDAFSLVCLDECHHATAETYNKILNRFSARYRVGVSATPDKTGDFALATHVLGPIIHETRPSEVNTLQKPTVIRVPTKFGFRFIGHRSRYQRSNYPQMIDAIIRDPERNMQIVKCVMGESGHHQLLVSKRLEHLAILRDLLEDEGFSDPIATITGKDGNDEREEAAALAGNEPSLILSTLADEALDIPRLDRLHLPFPQRNPGLVMQQVGRVERKHPEKSDALIFDYVDGNVGALDKQWRTRRFEVYEPRGYKIIIRKVEV